MEKKSIASKMPARCSMCGKKISQGETCKECGEIQEIYQNLKNRNAPQPKR